MTFRDEDFTHGHQGAADEAPESVGHVVDEHNSSTPSASLRRDEGEIDDEAVIEDEDVIDDDATHLSD